MYKIIANYNVWKRRKNTAQITINKGYASQAFNNSDLFMFMLYYFKLN